MQKHELYMSLCLQLARLGAGHVAPNPMVGAVLVYEDRIIGEGYHQQYGKAHAEVNCINSVRDEDKGLIENSVMYVSLEPCAHFGKTPPCADLIIKHKIKTVVVGGRDPFEQVDGKGIEKLENARIEVIKGVLENDCKSLNQRFFTFHTKKRPHIILKWAQSKNHRIANADFSRVLISNGYSNRLVHKWRSEEAAIMVGTNTALQDDPALNTRNWTGPSPTRLVVDMNLRLPSTLKVFDGNQKTIIFNGVKNEELQNVTYYKIEKEPSFVQSLLNACYKLNIQSILIEGGNKLAESFINENAWDEARVIENTQLIIDNGLRAPLLSNHQLVSSDAISTDVISYYKNLHNKL
ncbi:bifunctional diaminohydroxyphosphoribosylaminopyrimidine deaminase/5-amino-6-(5-phosphoribosylamino)uracil reductase RibD [Segetibacter aerophilus]|uniref:Riboflavin biosynthesis protein RibD n=1 Tax=Segetibacter aerophilus TaxID=670293 RepID=A0A512B9J0_9BACT|nr:bifunctional diaminohydroxyphosphoribosylaminopyrimidine deaminase/5-amino-6-(5-phosphoribosylamino)uracil reductase RibD [Segetibacter aerophilus]GEO08622.1 riboflavin biosynthesis protein RibD [Segetibacter aerophilus]